MGSKIIFRGTNDDIEVLTKRLRDSVDSTFGTEELSLREKLEWLVDKLGGEIRVAIDPTNAEGEGGSLVIYRKGRFVIWLSPYTSPMRDNFTIAHELGHYLLHYDHKSPHEGLPVVFNRYGADQYEWQANRFAAAFLMPQNKFKEIFEKLKKNKGRTAGYFEVSEPAVEVRAKSLGLIP